MTAVATVLDRAGLRISESRFARLVAEALEEFGPAGAADPAAELPAEEIAVLEEIGADLRPRRPRETDPRAGAAAAFVALLANARTVGQVADRLGIDPSRVRHRLAAGALLGIKRGRGWLLPAWQFGRDGSVLPGLARVGPALRTLHPVVAASFATTPQPELAVAGRARSPRDWLAGGGDPAPVVELAHALSDQF